MAAFPTKGHFLQAIAAPKRERRRAKSEHSTASPTEAPKRRVTIANFESISDWL